MLKIHHCLRYSSCMVYQTLDSFSIIDKIGRLNKAQNYFFIEPKLHFVFILSCNVKNMIRIVATQE